MLTNGDYGITFLEGKKISKIIIHSIIENQEQKLSLKLTLIHIINVKLSVRQESGRYASLYFHHTASLFFLLK